VIPSVSSSSNILILNRNHEETKLIQTICEDLGTVHCATSVKEALDLIPSVNFNLVIVDYFLGKYSTLKGLFKKTTSILITGAIELEISYAIRDWPHTRYVVYHVIPDEEKGHSSFLRTVQIALEHSHLIMEVEALRHSIEFNEVEFQEVFSQFINIKDALNESIVKETEKRIAIETKYTWFKKEKQKIEIILKKLYKANDVTNLLDIVYDIKEIIQAEGISIYILDENGNLGKYLKPLVWNNTVLSYPDISKYVVLLDSKDYAASTAKHGSKFNLTDSSFDNNLSQRYKEQLKTPLKSLLSVPIMYENTVIGVIEMYNKLQKRETSDNGFTNEDQQILCQLSEHIGIAITKLNLIQYDALTGLLRPDPFFEKIIQKIKDENKRREEDASYALVMGDVDWFKNYNDRNGHQAGNYLLRELAKVLKSSIREGDLLCRYGGEEFLFFLTSIKNIEETSRFTERMRKNVEDHYFKHQEFQPNNNLTMSFGITYFTKKMFYADDSINKTALKKLANEADIALAEAKGKNISGLYLDRDKMLPPNKNKVCIYFRKQKEIPDLDELIRPFKPDRVEEKRKSKRYYMSTVLIYRNKESQKVTKTVNLSYGGVKILTEDKLLPQGRFDLILILGNRACQCKGDVVYSEKGNGSFPSYYYSGLKFTDFSFKDRKILEDYFSSLSLSNPKR